MYQYSTYYPLAQSKTYIETEDKAVTILRKAVAMTNQWRAKEGKFQVNRYELENAQRLLKIIPDEMGGYPNFLGDSKELTTDNLEKAQNSSY